jgi:hypothetical protein
MAGRKSGAVALGHDTAGTDGEAEDTGWKPGAVARRHDTATAGTGVTTAATGDGETERGGGGATDVFLSSFRSSSFASVLCSSFFSKSSILRRRSLMVPRAAR